MLGHLRLDTFEATPLVREPFEYLIVSNFVDPGRLATINADYPKISTSGSFPVDQVTFGPAFRRFLPSLKAMNFAKLSRRNSTSIFRAGQL